MDNDSMTRTPNDVLGKLSWLAGGVGDIEAAR